MNLTQTHEALENWVSILTIANIIWLVWSGLSGWKNAGWREARRLKEEQMQKVILDLIENKQTQFTRIDELKLAVGGCVTRELHDQMQREVTERMDKFYASLSSEIKIGFAQVNTRIDNLFSSGKGI